MAAVTVTATMLMVTRRWFAEVGCQLVYGYQDQVLLRSRLLQSCHQEKCLGWRPRIPRAHAPFFLSPLRTGLFLAAELAQATVEKVAVSQVFFGP